MQMSGKFVALHNRTPGEVPGESNATPDWSARKVAAYQEPCPGWNRRSRDAWDAGGWVGGWGGGGWGQRTTRERLVGRH